MEPNLKGEKDEPKAEVTGPGLGPGLAPLVLPDPLLSLWGQGNLPTHIQSQLVFPSVKWALWQNQGLNEFILVMLWEVVKAREARSAAVHGLTVSPTRLSDRTTMMHTEQSAWPKVLRVCLFSALYQGTLVFSLFNFYLLSILDC